MKWLQPNKDKYRPTPLWDAVILIAGVEIALMAVVGVVGWLLKWPTPWDYGRGMLAGGVVVWMLGTFTRSGTEGYVRRSNYTFYQELSVSPVSAEERMERDRLDLKAAIATAWFSTIVGVLGIAIGLIVMASFPP